MQMGLFTKRKIIVAFRTHGCQATIKEPLFVGEVIGRRDTNRTVYYSCEFYYKVKVLVAFDQQYKDGEIEIPAWYCLKNKEGVLIYED